MRKKGRRILVLFLAMALASIFFQKTRSKSESGNKSTESQARSFRSVSGTQVTAPGKQGVHLIFPKREFPETREEILEKIAALQGSFDEARRALTPSFERMEEEEQAKFQEGLLAVSRERARLAEFLDSLEPPVREETAEFLKTAFELQDQYLALDGDSPEDLKPRQAKIPGSLQARAESLRVGSFPGEVESHVKTVARNSAVRTEDIDKLARLCGSAPVARGRCVEKGVLAWLDANHLLTEPQLSRIENFIRDQGE